MGAQQAPPPRDGVPAPGQVLGGKFRVDAVIGQGGMGVVLAAHHLYLDQRVALKLLSQELVQTPEALARFLNEARLAARIRSDHISRVMDMGQLDDGRPYIAMEFLEGIDLATLIQTRGALPYGEAVDYIVQTLDALAHAHAVGVVHRDLKPSNLFLANQADGPPIVKILDFGISKVDASLVVPDKKGITSSRAVVGSPMYMSPEQIRDSKRVDARADIWSIGVILYELLAGRLPFDGDTPGEIFANVVTQPLRTVRAFRPDVPEALDRVVDRCLQRQRDERFRDVGELAFALTPFVTQERFESVNRIQAAVVKGDVAKAQLQAGGADGTGPRRPSVPAAAVVGAPNDKTLPYHPNERTQLVPRGRAAFRGAATLLRRRQAAASIVAGVSLVVALVVIVVCVRIALRRPAPSSDPAGTTPSAIPPAEASEAPAASVSPPETVPSTSTAPPVRLSPRGRPIRPPP
jgi:serine/threonine protein kinase